MQYDFLKLFPVAVAGISVIMDIRTAKVDNGWILFSMFIGMFIRVWQKGIAGLGHFVMGSVTPLFLIVLFVFGMIGAGDIKLFCVLGGILGPGAVLKCIFSSFISPDDEEKLCVFFFIRYAETTVTTGKITPYRKGNISAPENFHFTVPILVSVLLYAGGIY